MTQTTNVPWSSTGPPTRSERDTELNDARREVRRTLAAKLREWLDDEVIDQAGTEEVEAAARLLAGARCIWWGDSFTEEDCVPSGEWEPRFSVPSPGMLLLLALGLVARCEDEEYGGESYLLSNA